MEHITAGKDAGRDTGKELGKELGKEFGLAGGTAGRRRVRMTRETGQSLVLSSLCMGCGADGARLPVEIRVSQVCAGGVAILEVLLPDSMFVERKETLDGVRALFPAQSAAPPVVD